MKKQLISLLLFFLFSLPAQAQSTMGTAGKMGGQLTRLEQMRVLDKLFSLSFNSCQNPKDSREQKKKFKDIYILVKYAEAKKPLKRDQTNCKEETCIFDPQVQVRLKEFVKHEGLEEYLKIENKYSDIEIENIKRDLESWILE